MSLLLNDKCDNGQMLLHLAAKLGKENILSYLLEQERVGDEDGYTRIHLMKPDGCLQVLREHHCEMTRRKKLGQTVLHCALKQQHKCIIENLLK